MTTWGLCRTFVLLSLTGLHCTAEIYVNKRVNSSLTTLGSIDMSKIDRYCIVTGCKTTQKDNISLHCLPEKLDSDWSRVVFDKKPINWRPKKRTLICALHFPKNQIVGRKLVPGASPFLNLPVSHAVHNGMLITELNPLFWLFLGTRF